MIERCFRAGVFPGWKEAARIVFKRLIGGQGELMRVSPSWWAIMRPEDLGIRASDRSELLHKRGLDAANRVMIKMPEKAGFNWDMRLSDLGGRYLLMVKGRNHEVVVLSATPDVRAMCRAEFGWDEAALNAKCLVSPEFNTRETQQLLDAMNRNIGFGLRLAEADEAEEIRSQLPAADKQTIMLIRPYQAGKYFDY